MKKAPWKDWTGKDIYEGDMILHPSGEIGLVIFHPEHHDSSDQWMVQYNNSDESRLCLQIGDKGRAIVVYNHNI